LLAIGAHEPQPQVSGAPVAANEKIHDSSQNQVAVPCETVFARLPCYRRRPVGLSRADFVACFRLSKPKLSPACGV
jgi:hypothetical protein